MQWEKDKEKFLKKSCKYGVCKLHLDQRYQDPCTITCSISGHPDQEAKSNEEILVTHRGGTGWREWLLSAPKVYRKGISKTAITWSPTKDEVRRHNEVQLAGVLCPLSPIRNLPTTLGRTSRWLKSGQALRTHTSPCWWGHGGIRVCEWVKWVFTFKQGQALRVATFLLQRYNSSSCNGGRKLLSVFWLMLGGHTGYSEYVGTPSNSVSLLCFYLWLVTVPLKGCLERHCFHKDLAGFPIQLSTILKGS